MQMQGGANESFTVEQCPLCNAKQSARSCPFRTKPTDELLQCSETGPGDAYRKGRGGVDGGKVPHAPLPFRTGGIE